MKMSSRLKKIMSGSARGVGFSFGNTNLLCFVLGETTTDMVKNPSKPDILIPKHGRLSVGSMSRQMTRTAIGCGNKLTSTAFLLRS